MFDVSNSISTFSFLSAFQTECIPIGIQEGAELWLLHLFMMKPDGAAFKQAIVRLVQAQRISREN